MLSNRKVVKSYSKSLFTYQTNRSGDSFERYEAYNSSSSSDTFSSDQLSRSSLNSSTSSLITSSDNSSEFNEVEQVIEEYFLRKIARNSSKNVSLIQSISEKNDHSNKSTEIEKSRSLRSSEVLCENLFWKNTFISSVEVGTQVSNTDFKKECLVNREKRNIRSKSFDFALNPGIWNLHKNFRAYLNKTVLDMDLCFLFQNTHALIPKFCETRRHSVIVDPGNCIRSRHVFKTYFSRFPFSTLSVPMDRISPLKSILLVDRQSSKILLFNDKAKLLFRLKDAQFPQYFNTFLIDEFKYANLVDHFVDESGMICSLPAKMVLCRDSYDYYFYASVRFQTMKEDIGNWSDVDSVILVIEPLRTDSGLCIHNYDAITAFNRVFVNVLQLQNMKQEDIFVDIFHRLLSSKCHLGDTSQRTNTKEIKHNILKFTDQELPFHFLSTSNPITQMDAKSYSKTYNLVTSSYLTVRGDLYATNLWFFSNLSCVLTISLLGKIIGCNPYFNFLVGYSVVELLKMNINEILKFNSFEFDAMLLLGKGNGKYDATLSHLDGSHVNSIVWVYKQEDTVDTSFYTLWLVTDDKEYTFPHTIHSHSPLHEGSSINLDELLCDLPFKGFDKFTIDKKKYTNLNYTSNVHDALSCVKKVKSLSLPETRSYNYLKVSPWSFITTVDGKESNTSSDISEHFKDINANKDLDIFHNDYNILNVIGKGAFGFVRLATSMTNNEEFVIKFIRKNKLAIEHMVTSSISDVNKSERRTKLLNGYEEASEDKIVKTNIGDHQETTILIPREIWMLCQLNHENIVALHDWYEGADHYQMIMPKHGVGMDLFEFIDRSPLLDEELVSHIFRQLASAIAYLHDLMISHRDIKDENIILDDVFKIKLIDFGAAVKVEPDQKFKTFCGTMEFCSPEILLGQEYNCFHADIWSMGITLYTIMFGENPFYDFEETINAVLKPPKIISTDLFQLLSMLLEPNPLKRITAGDLTSHPWLNQKVDIRKYTFQDIVPNSVFCGNMASDFRKYSVDSNCEMIERKSLEALRSKESEKQDSF